MRLFKILLASSAFVLAVLSVPLVNAISVSAQSNEEALCEGSGGTWSDGECTSPDSDRTLMGTIQQVTNVLLFIGGSIAVVMLIIGGIRYVVSAGDQTAVTAAKNTIMYAIIGLVIILIAFAIVNFVLEAFDA